MSALFPTSLPLAGAALTTQTLSQAGHTALHNNGADESRALATKMGTGSSTPTANTFLHGTGAGTSGWAQVDLSTADVINTLAVAKGGTGTTTSTGTGSVVLGTSPTIATPTISSPTISGTVGGSATYTTPTLTTPTIADYTNAQHTHASAAQGGTLGNSVITSAMIAAGCVIGATGQALNPIPATATDLTGTSVTFTVTAACYISVIFGATSLQTNQNNQANVFLNLDGSNQSTSVFQTRAGDGAGTELHTSPSATIPRIALSIGSHTIKLQVQANTTNVCALNGFPHWMGFITNQT